MSGLDTSRLRIAMLGTRGLPATYGGVEHHVEQVGSRLVERGHEVTVYSESRYAGELRLTEHLGMRVVTLPTVPVRSLEAISHSAMATTRGLVHSPDVVHYHAVGPGLAAPLARFGSRSAIVQTVHGLDAERSKWGGGARRVLNLATWMSARVPDTTVTVSRALADHYARHYDRECTYVPNGITPRRPRPPRLMRRHGLAGGDYVLFVGRLVPEKRPDLLIRAWRALETDLRLVVVGGSSYTDDYVAELERLAEGDPRVVLPGYLYGAELDELFANAAAFVQPSALEGLPLTLLEAMGSGLPVVVSDIAPHREIVTADRPGARVFAAGDADALGRALTGLLTGLDVERAAAQERRLETVSAYDWGVAVDALEAVYHGALEARWARRRLRGVRRSAPPPTLTPAAVPPQSASPEAPRPAPPPASQIGTFRA